MSRPCRSGKTGSYPTEQAATDALVDILNSGGLDRLVAPCRVYRCRCGRWHLTSKPAYRSGEVL